MRNAGGFKVLKIVKWIESYCTRKRMQIITLRSVRCSYSPTAHTEHASYNLAAGMICFHEAS